MIFWVLIILIVLLDQWSKGKALKLLKDKKYTTTAKIFQLRLAKNTGAFYGLFRNKKRFLLAITSFAIIGCVYLLYLGIKNQEPLSYNLAFSFLIGGALGNFIDRFKRGYVVDFLQINIKRGPIFNLADVSIFIGALFVFYMEIL